MHAGGINFRGESPLREDGTMMRQGHSSLNAAISARACRKHHSHCTDFVQ